MKVLIWGTGETTRKLMQFLRGDIEIQAFVETIPSKKVFMDKKVVNSNDIKQYKYDYILIMSRFSDEILKILSEIDIPKQKIMVCDNAKYIEYMEYKKDYFHTRDRQLNGEQDKIQVLCTGISYHNDGIDINQFPIKAFNFALRAQDVFFDFQIVKYLLEQKKEKFDLKYVIIGLNYFSFEYDFSKSTNCKEIVQYYPEIMLTHNMMNDEYYEEFVKRETERLLQYAYFDKIFTMKLPKYELNDEEGEHAAFSDFNKHYPITIYENKKILDEYITYLEEHNIKPIILIMPVTKHYAKFCPKEKKRLFCDSLAEVLENHEVQVLDYFDTYECPDTYYYHVTHFNKKGAEEFTKQLMKDIVW